MQRAKETDEHPFGDVEVGFARERRQAAQSKKIFFRRQIVAVHCGDRGVSHPREIAQNEQPAGQWPQFRLPVVREKILAAQGSAGRRARAREIPFCLLDVFVIDVPTSQRRARKRLRGRDEKGTHSTSRFKNNFRDKPLTPQQSANLPGQRQRRLEVAELSLRV